jgi:hypothetical protein
VLENLALSPLPPSFISFPFLTRVAFTSYEERGLLTFYFLLLMEERISHKRERTSYILLLTREDNILRRGGHLTSYRKGHRGISKGKRGGEREGKGRKIRHLISSSAVKYTVFSYGREIL